MQVKQSAHAKEQASRNNLTKQIEARSNRRTSKESGDDQAGQKGVEQGQGPAGQGGQEETVKGERQVQRCRRDAVGWHRQEQQRQQQAADSRQQAGQDYCDRTQGNLISISAG